MNKLTNCVIIDDDPSAVDLLIEYISEVPRLKLAEVYYDSLNALSELVNLEENLIIFLDIHMPKFSGMQLAEKLKHKAFQFIFTTGHAEHALRAFDVNARKFLLKPFELPSFVDAVTEVIMLNYQSCASSEPDWFFAKTGERQLFTKIYVNEIIFVKAIGNYVTITTPDKSYHTYMTLREMANRLKESAGFFRVHRSFIINVNYVSRLIGNVIFLDKHEVLMSNKYKENFSRFAEYKTLKSKRL